MTESLDDLRLELKHLEQLRTHYSLKVGDLRERITSLETEKLEVRDTASWRSIAGKNAEHLNNLLYILIPDAIGVFDERVPVAIERASILIDDLRLLKIGKERLIVERKCLVDFIAKLSSVVNHTPSTLEPCFVDCLKCEANRIIAAGGMP